MDTFRKKKDFIEVKMPLNVIKKKKLLRLLKIGLIKTRDFNQYR